MCSAVVPTGTTASIATSGSDGGTYNLYGMVATVKGAIIDPSTTFNTASSSLGTVTSRSIEAELAEAGFLLAFGAIGDTAADITWAGLDAVVVGEDVTGPRRLCGGFANDVSGATRTVSASKTGAAATFIIKSISVR
jgi:hypothetical protein